MERGDRAPVATFFTQDLHSDRAEIALGGSAAHHAVVRRLAEGERIRLTDGSGRRGIATIASLRKNELVASVESIEHVPRPPLLEVLAPVGDRDRMLWLAEKCAELGVSIWQPVIFARSRSVSPRGEGEAFGAKVRARMIAALEQSGGAWLPEVRRELPLRDAATAATAGARYVLDSSGTPLDGTEARGGAAVTFGPEGGIEPSEHSFLRSAGWRPTRLGPTTLRFETAGIAAVAILRAAVASDDAEV